MRDAGCVTVRVVPCLRLIRAIFPPMRRDDPPAGGPFGASMAVPDLAALKRQDLQLSAEQVVEGEMQAGLRCGVCLERITEGVEVVRMVARFHPEHGMVGVIAESYCCPRQACRDELLSHGDAIAVRAVSQHFLTPDLMPHPKQEGGEQDGDGDAGSASVGEGSGSHGAAPGGQ